MAVHQLAVSPRSRNQMAEPDWLSIVLGAEDDAIAIISRLDAIALLFENGCETDKRFSEVLRFLIEEVDKRARALNDKLYFKPYR